MSLIKHLVVCIISLILNILASSPSEMSLTELTSLKTKKIAQ